MKTYRGSDKSLAHTDRISNHTHSPHFVGMTLRFVTLSYSDTSLSNRGIFITKNVTDISCNTDV